jgi:hypothetical protein
MRLAVPFVYEAYVATSEEDDSHRALVLAKTELDLREASSAEMLPAASYRTASGRVRTLRSLDGGFYEEAYDVSVPLRFKDSRAAEATFHRRHGFLGTPDRRGRIMIEESFSRYPFTIDSDDKESVLRRIQGEAPLHVACDGRAWLRVPEPVLVTQVYDAEADPAQFHYLRAQGAPDRKGVFLSVRSFDPRQNSDGVARLDPSDVFNLRDLDRAKRHAGELAKLWDTRAHISVEAETRKLHQPFLFQFNQSRARLNAEMADLAERHIDRFARDDVRHAADDTVRLWLELRNAFDAATATGARDTLTPYDMDPAKLQFVAERLGVFALAARRGGLIEQAELKTVQGAIVRWPKPDPSLPADGASDVEETPQVRP